MDDINFKIPKQHLPEVTNLLRNHLGEVRNTETREWLKTQGITNLESQGGSVAGTGFAGKDAGR